MERNSVPMTFCWRGVPASDMTREELYDAILELDLALKREREDNTRLRIENIWANPPKNRRYST